MSGARCSTSLHGTDHVISACQGAKDSSEEIVATKEITFCDFLTTDQVLEDVQPNDVKPKLVEIESQATASTVNKYDTASERESDPEDFGYVTEENQEGFSIEANLADDEAEAEDEVNEKRTVRKIKDTTDSEIITLNPEKAIVKQDIDHSVVGTLESVCDDCYQVVSRPASPAFHTGIDLVVTNLDRQKTIDPITTDFSEKFKKKSIAMSDDQQQPVFTAPLQGLVMFI